MVAAVEDGTRAMRVGFEGTVPTDLPLVSFLLGLPHQCLVPPPRRGLRDEEEQIVPYQRIPWRLSPRKWGGRRPISVTIWRICSTMVPKP